MGTRTNKYNDNEKVGCKMIALENADVRDAMLWFLRKEKYRHEQDIKDLDRDITNLIYMGARDIIDPVSNFIQVPELEVKILSRDEVLYPLGKE